LTLELIRLALELVRLTVELIRLALELAVELVRLTNHLALVRLTLELVRLALEVRLTLELVRLAVELIRLTLEVWLALELSVRSTLERDVLAELLRRIDVHDARRRSRVGANDADTVSTTTAASICRSGSCHHNSQTHCTREEPVFCEAAHDRFLYVFRCFEGEFCFLPCPSA